MKIESSELTCAQISIKYGISPSLVNKINRTSLDQLNEVTNKGLTKIYGENKEKITSEMIKYSNKSQHIFTVNGMAKHISLKFNSNYSKCFIRGLMRNVANLRYKKVKPRP